jgi:hypothetical protein
LDSRDLIVLGLVGLGGYVAYRWWIGRPVTDAATTAPQTIDGLSASSMTATAARTTVFGQSFTQKLLSPFANAPRTRSLSPTAPAGVVAAEQQAAFQPVRAQVSAAVLAPMPVAPSPNNVRYSSTGLINPAGTQPDGDPPELGDPSRPFVLQTRGFA